MGGLSEGFDRLDVSTRDYDAAAKALINTQIAVTNAQKQTTKATEDGKCLLHTSDAADELRRVNLCCRHTIDNTNYLKIVVQDIYTIHATINN